MKTMGLLWHTFLTLAMVICIALGCRSCAAYLLAPQGCSEHHSTIWMVPHDGHLERQDDEDWYHLDKVEFKLLWVISDAPARQEVPAAAKLQLVLQIGGQNQADG
jgi:hypothetical protein